MALLSSLVLGWVSWKEDPETRTWEKVASSEGVPRSVSQWVEMTDKEEREINKETPLGASMVVNFMTWGPQRGVRHYSGPVYEGVLDEISI